MLRDPEGTERRFLHDLLGPSAGNLLEIGCGDGRLTRELADISATVLGLDPDPDSVQNARLLLGKGINLIRGSGEKIPLADDVFETVVFSLSLHHHLDAHAALGEARRVLKKGGRVLVLEPEPESGINRLFRMIHNEDGAYEKARGALRACDFEITGQGSYETVWKFENFSEMVKRLFSYFDMDPDPEISDSFESELADRSRSVPLEVGDITLYWVLRHKPQTDRHRAHFNPTSTP